jgi:hypothetical protein
MGNLGFSGGITETAISGVEDNGSKSVLPSFCVFNPIRYWLFWGKLLGKLLG